MTTITHPAAPALTAGEERHVLTGITWDEYCAVNDALDDHPSIRMFYLMGSLEIVSTSPLHEVRKKSIARFLELYSTLRRVRLLGYGQTTFRKKAKKRGAEPDECYYTGEFDPAAPEIVIEVVITSGGVDKLAIYSGLGVKEVWFWTEEAGFEIHRLSGGKYRRIAKSRLLPDLDLDELARHVRNSDQFEAAVAYQEILSRGR